MGIKLRVNRSLIQLIENEQQTAGQKGGSSRFTPVQIQFWSKVPQYVYQNDPCRKLNLWYIKFKPNGWLKRRFITVQPGSNLVLIQSAQYVYQNDPWRKLNLWYIKFKPNGWLKRRLITVQPGSNSVLIESASMCISKWSLS